GYCLAATMKLLTTTMTAVALTTTQAVQPAAMKAMPVMSHELIRKRKGILGSLKAQIVTPRATRAQKGGTRRAIHNNILLRGPAVTGSSDTGKPFCKASICRSCHIFCFT